MDILSEEPKEYANQRFRSLSFQGKLISDKAFYDCVFEECSLKEAVLRSCQFVECVFRRCDLSLVDVMGSSFRDTRFEESQVMGVDWTKANWGEAGLLNAIHFTRCAISYTTFFGLTLRGIMIVDCMAKDADFAEADLTLATCTGTDFSESRFFHTILEEADFTDATNYAINAAVNTLRRTRFSLPEAMSLLHSLDIILEGP